MQRLVTFLLLFSCLKALAQPGTNDIKFNTLDPGYSAGEGPNSIVNTLAIQADGKVIIGGDFTKFNEKIINRIARIDENFLDSTFKTGSGFNNKVLCMAIQKNGKIIVGGNFTSYNGVTRNRIARLNSDGSLDMTFDPKTGFNNLVKSVAIQKDGKIIVGGSFSSYSGTTRNGIARLDSVGKLDASYNSGSGFNSEVNAIIFQKDGKAVVGGSFTLFNSAIAERIVRLKTNGTMDSSFNFGFGFDKSVNSISQVSNDKFVVGGTFDNFNGASRKRIAMLDSTGALVSSFNPNGGFNGWVYCTSVQSDGKIIAVGDFTSFNGTAINKIIRLKQSGAMDSSFGVGSGFSSGGMVGVFATALHADGRIVAVGSFTTYNYKARNNLVRIFPDGRHDNTLNMFTGFNGLVRVITKQTDGKILVGGDFTFLNGADRSGIARLNMDGSLDTTFKPGLGIKFVSTYTGVYSMAVQKDGKIVVGGGFFSYNGKYTYNLIRLYPDGSLDTTFKTGTGAGGGIVLDMVIQSDGKIIIGGTFGSFNAYQRKGLARVNTDGSCDTLFAPGVYPDQGFDRDVFALALQKDGKILVGGSFTKYKKTYFNNKIIRLNTDGNLDSAFNYANGFNSSVDAIAIQNDGKIVVGGSFTSFNSSVSRNKIARILSNGKLDSTFYPGSSGFNGTVNNIIVQDDGQILVAGAFTSFNSVTHNRICRLNPVGTPDKSIDFGGGFPSTLETIALQNDGKILAGGNFTSFDKFGRNRITRINNNCIKNLHTINKNSCNSYTFNGKTYTSSGSFIDSFTNVYGCDSVITTNLTINKDSKSTLTQTGCDSLVINGQSFSNSGTYNQTISNYYGCDSAITLNLTIKKSTGSTITTSACDTYKLNTQTYTSSGKFTQVISNAKGCDSVITLNLSIKKSSSHSITTSACDTYKLNTQSYTASGKYEQIITNAAGCDSVITLNLTIITVDTSVIRPGSSSLKANAIGATYQWLDCNNTSNPELQGETNQLFTAKTIGKYAVRITKNSCTKTSACFEIKTTGIVKPTFTSKISLYPNPTENYITLASEQSLEGGVIKVSDLTGRVFYIRNADKFETTIDLTAYPKGIYFLELNYLNNIVRFKILRN